MISSLKYQNKCCGFVWHICLLNRFLSSGKHAPPSYKMSWSLVLKFLDKVLQLEGSGFKIRRVKKEKTMWMLIIIFLRMSERKSVFISHVLILINTSDQRRMQQICLDNSFANYRHVFSIYHPHTVTQNKGSEEGFWKTKFVYSLVPKFW